MVIVVRDSDRSRVRVHVNYRVTELILQVAALPMYPEIFVAVGICCLAVFVQLNKANTLLVHDHKIDRG